MKKRQFWSVLFLVLAFLTVRIIISRSKCFSFVLFKNMLCGSSAGWMLAAVASMLAFIVFEGSAILCIIKTLGHRKSLKQGFLYSAADIYFSAITPSAMGGQPASAYFMIKDGMSGAVVTMSLMVNLIMYTLALLTVGTTSFVIKPSIFFQFRLMSRTFIVAGYLILCSLAAVFYLLTVKPHVLEKICRFFLGLGKKIHLVKRENEKQEKLRRAMAEYRQCANIMAGHKLMFLKAFLFNLLQRASQITVTLFVYLAVGNERELAADIWFTQSYVTIGTYCVPIPGGMGVADYLLIDGLQAYFDETYTVNLELISRGVSFYVCMIVSALTVLIGMICTSKRRNLN